MPGEATKRQQEKPRREEIKRLQETDVDPGGEIGSDSTVETENDSCTRQRDNRSVESQQELPPGNK
ncbi:MAG TPA: hypothetical protein VOA64_10515 [Candidatus Dormibacteraeota bacterium]|nr:hypothetical protein [Candidatus Dormibacteraeota bacterium]